MGLFVAGIGMATRRDPDGSMGSNRVALFSHPELQQAAATTGRVQSVKSETPEDFDLGRHETDG